MKSYREMHIGPNMGVVYDSMHENRVDSLIWRNFVKPYVTRTMQAAAKRGAQSYLDFACGTGRLLKVGQPIFPSSIGIDISDDMLDVARKRVPGATILNVDVTRDTTAVQGTYDVVTMFRFLLNAEPDLRRGTLNWISEHTTRGSVLILNNHRALFSINGVLARLTKQDGVKELNVLRNQDVKLLLNGAGFYVTKQKGFRVLPSIHGRAVLGNRAQLVGEHICQHVGLHVIGAERVFVALRR